MPDDVEPHFVFAEDPIVVEHCMKAMLSGYIYRNNKEFYIISCNKLITIMEKCTDLVKNGFDCELCNAKMDGPKRLLNHYTNHHQHEEYEKNVILKDVVQMNINDQLGGYDDIINDELTSDDEEEQTDEEEEDEYDKEMKSNMNGMIEIVDDLEKKYDKDENILYFNEYVKNRQLYIGQTVKKVYDTTYDYFPKVKKYRKKLLKLSIE